MAGSSNGQRNDTPKQAKKHRPDVKANRSILTFFKKVEVEEPLFLESPAPGSRKAQTAPDDDEIFRDDTLSAEWRFNEIENSNKRRRLDIVENNEDSENANSGPARGFLHTRSSPKLPKAVSGFVIDDSDDDDGDEVDAPIDHGLTIKDGAQHALENPGEPGPKSEIIRALYATPDESSAREDGDDDGNLGDSADVEQWPDDEGLDGPENREIRCSQEQAKLEEDEDGSSSADDLPNFSEAEETCPICNGSLVGASADDATRHVNGCLDGNPTPLPKLKLVGSTLLKTPDPVSHGRVLPAAISVLGQARPLKANSSAAAPGSAFSKLMAHSVEEAAWSSAAPDNTVRDKGNNNRQRTCPFYKIMPGFFITVDAFRYGAVDGCNAYFLSHFHSDHYMGLGSSWTHGPIYCSQATANLVEQQLKVNEKWLVPLEFERRYDIPNTDGASVYMIDANHCPGSSLFLFEKTMGSGPREKKYRILHCGDFRACKAHITHPLLRPETADPGTGRQGRQAIDACYLDTTYLNPRYSFPPQDDVIAACAELCAAMQANPDNKRPWEKNDRGGNGNGSSISRFVSLTRKPKAPEPPKIAANPFTVASGATKPIDPPPAVPGAAAGKKYSPNRLLVVCGTYSIGKERIVVAIARALGSKIFAPAAKRRICKALGDKELDALMTTDPLEAQVHIQSLGDVNTDALKEYLGRYKPHFARAVAFRPSGWNYTPGQNIGGQKQKEKQQQNRQNVGVTGGKAVLPGGKGTMPANVPTAALLYHPTWRTRFGLESLRPSRGWTEEAMVFGVPYSEHSSFRDLALFVMGLDIGKVVPTVNVGSPSNRARMKAWIDKWTAERRKGGFLRVLEEGDGGDGVGDGEQKEEPAVALWDGNCGRGVYW